MQSCFDKSRLIEVDQVRQICRFGLYIRQKRKPPSACIVMGADWHGRFLPSKAKRRATTKRVHVGTHLVVEEFGAAADFDGMGQFSAGNEPVNAAHRDVQMLRYGWYGNECRNRAVFGFRIHGCVVTYSIRLRARFIRKEVAKTRMAYKFSRNRSSASSGKLAAL